MSATRTFTPELAAVRLAAVLLTAMAIVTIVARPAQAAPPTIAASDEEVLFGIGDTDSKFTTITWDVGDEDEAEVTLSKNGGPSNTLSNLPAGSEVFEVQPESATYLFCVQQDRDVFACVTVKSTIMTITPGEEKAKPDPNIDLGFIHKISADPSGYSAKISYTTDSPAIPVVLVSQKKPLAFPVLSADQPKVFETQDVEGVSFNFVDGPQTSHTNKLINLDPGTTYHYVISAENKATGYWQTQAGTFKTLRRVVSVFFEEIKMWDDSDDTSPGDMVFKFAINGDAAPNGSTMQAVFDDFSTGETKSVNDTGFIVDAPAQLEITAFGCDDDEMETPTSENYCLLYSPAELPLEGDDFLWGMEWTQKTSSYDVGPNVNEANPESFKQNFTITVVPSDGISELSFKVTGFYSVTFVK